MTLQSLPEINLTDAECIDRIVKLREYRAKIKKAFKEQDDRASAGIDALQAQLLKSMNEAQIENVKTSEGTAYMHRQTFARVTDWEAFYAHVLETGKVELLSKRVASGNVLEVLEETGEMPPGVTTDTTREVRIRKA